MNSKLFFAITACLTLGLAPFVPHPHIYKQLRRLIFYPSHMEPIDWLDLAMHGAPWIFLIIVVVPYFKKRRDEKV